MSEQYTPPTRYKKYYYRIGRAQGTFPLSFPYLFWPPERRSHGYFEGNVQILCVRRAVQVTTVYPTIPTLSQTYLS